MKIKIRWDGRSQWIGTSRRPENRDRKKMARETTTKTAAKNSYRVFSFALEFNIFCSFFCAEQCVVTQFQSSFHWNYGFPHSFSHHKQLLICSFQWGVPVRTPRSRINNGKSIHLRRGVRAFNGSRSDDLCKCYSNATRIDTAEHCFTHLGTTNQLVRVERTARRMTQCWLRWFRSTMKMLNLKRTVRRWNTLNCRNQN